jgi:hypothetical protein
MTYIIILIICTNFLCVAGQTRRSVLPGDGPDERHMKCSYRSSRITHVWRQEPGFVYSENFPWVNRPRLARKISNGLTELGSPPKPRAWTGPSSCCVCRLMDSASFHSDGRGGYIGVQGVVRERQSRKLDTAISGLGRAIACLLTGTSIKGKSEKVGDCPRTGMRKEKSLKCKDKKSDVIGKVRAPAWWISSQLFLFSCPRSLFLCFQWVFLCVVVICLENLQL